MWCARRSCWGCFRPEAATARQRGLVCERGAAKGSSIRPIIWLGCANKLNAALIKEISQTLVP